LEYRGGKLSLNKIIGNRDVDRIVVQDVDVIREPNLVHKLKQESARFASISTDIPHPEINRL
jgi:hypothetical protein